MDGSASNWRDNAPEVTGGHKIPLCHPKRPVGCVAAASIACHGRRIKVGWQVP